MRGTRQTTQTKAKGADECTMPPELAKDQLHKLMMVGRYQSDEPLLAKADAQHGLRVVIPHRSDASC